MHMGELYRLRKEAEANAGREINHVGSPQSMRMSDWHTCSCGWESERYHDGREYAQEDWVSHIQSHGAEINYPQPA